MYHRLYRRPSATLRQLEDEERDVLSALELEPVVSANAWIGIEDESLIAARSAVDPRTERTINADLSDRALEGMPEDRRTKIRRRAAWLADKFVRMRKTSGQLHCDDCGFDPAKLFDPKTVNVRSLLDVHHKHPLDEGERYTTVKDFALLCPTCHRVEHQRLKLSPQTRTNATGE